MREAERNSIGSSVDETARASCLVSTESSLLHTPHAKVTIFE